MDGWMGGWMDGRTDGYIYIYLAIFARGRQILVTFYTDELY